MRTTENLPLTLTLSRKGRGNEESAYANVLARSPEFKSRDADASSEVRVRTAIAIGCFTANSPCPPGVCYVRADSLAPAGHNKSCFNYLAFRLLDFTGGSVATRIYFKTLASAGIVAAAFAVHGVADAAILFADNFESYAPGSNLVGQGG